MAQKVSEYYLILRKPHSQSLQAACGPSGYSSLPASHEPSQHYDFPWSGISLEQTKSCHCDSPNEITAPNALAVRETTEGKS